MSTVRHINRIERYPGGVIGVHEGGQYHGEQLVFYTLENADTLFPVGEYICKRNFYHAGNYPTFEIIVPGRSRILYHGANWVRNPQTGELMLRGCVAPGMEYGMDGDVPAVWRSRVAHDRFMESLVGVDEFTLIVTENF